MTGFFFYGKFALPSSFFHFYFTLLQYIGVVPVISSIHNYKLFSYFRIWEIDFRLVFRFLPPLYQPKPTLARVPDTRGGGGGES